jgi:hypothetical protein
MSPGEELLPVLQGGMIASPIRSGHRGGSKIYFHHSSRLEGAPFPTSRCFLIRMPPPRKNNLRVQAGDVDPLQAPLCYTNHLAQDLA